MEFMVEVFRDRNNGYIASCPKLDIYSYGNTVDKAVSRLEKIVNFYIESAKELGVTLEELCLNGKEVSPPRVPLPQSSRRYLH